MGVTLVNKIIYRFWVYGFTRHHLFIALCVCCPQFSELEFGLLTSTSTKT